MGRAVCRETSRHVCLCRGRNAAGTQRPRHVRVSCARPAGHQAALLRARRAERSLFASEVRALLASRCVPPQLSAEAVPSYLLFGSVCEPMTMVQGVFSLPPGHSLEIRADEPCARPSRSLTGISPGTSPESADATRKSARQIPPPQRRAVRALLEDSVRGHLIADVPIGVFLSSGLDSTVIAALASQVQKGVHTFTVAFPDLEFSEAENGAAKPPNGWAREHSEMISGAEMVARLDEAVASFDQPSMDGINTFFVSWAARQAGLKVALSGLGSDELFGGLHFFSRDVAGGAPGGCGALRSQGGFANWPPLVSSAPKLTAAPRTSFARRSLRGLTRTVCLAIFLYAGALHAADRCEPPGRRHLRVGCHAVDAVADERGAASAADGSLYAHIVARAAFLSGEYAVAGYRRDEHASFAGSAGAVPGRAVGRVRPGSSGIAEGQCRQAEIAFD